MTNNSNVIVPRCITAVPSVSVWVQLPVHNIHIPGSSKKVNDLFLPTQYIKHESEETQLMKKIKKECNEKKVTERTRRPCEGVGCGDCVPSDVCGQALHRQ